MVYVSNNRAIIEKLVKKACEEAYIKKRKVTTIDPILNVGRKLFPFIDERELYSYACISLRIIINKKIEKNPQKTLNSYLFDLKDF